MSEGDKKLDEENLPAEDEPVEQEPNTYMIRPNFAHKFRAAQVKEVVHSVLNEELADKSYDAEATTALCKLLSNEIKGKLKELEYDRYKFIVQIVIGEQRGEGVKMGCKCFWDSDTDSCAQDIFMNGDHMSNDRVLGKAELVSVSCMIRDRQLQLFEHMACLPEDDVIHCVLSTWALVDGVAHKDGLCYAVGGYHVLCRSCVRCILLLTKKS